MSRPQDPHRGSFPFGNPFRMMKPKGGVCPSPGLLDLLNAFEERLAGRLRKLRPESKYDILSLAWMQLAMELLIDTHNDIKSLIMDLVLPVCDWGDKWIDVYLNNSMKLLDICIAFSSEISRLPSGQPELIALEKAVKDSMVPSGMAREGDTGRSVPLFEVEAINVEKVFQTLYSYLFDLENGGGSGSEDDRPEPSAIFLVNFDKVRIDPRNKEIDLDSLVYGKI